MAVSVQDAHCWEQATDHFVLQNSSYEPVKKNFNLSFFSDLSDHCSIFSVYNFDILDTLLKESGINFCSMTGLFYLPCSS